MWFHLLGLFKDVQAGEEDPLAVLIQSGEKGKPTSEV